MICWGGLSFVTVAASGWQMVVRKQRRESRKGEEREGQARLGRYEIDRERTYACKGASVRSCTLKRQGWCDICPRGWMKGRDEGKRRKR